MAKKLKKCPTCKERPVVELYRTEDSSNYVYAVACRYCSYVRTKYYNTRKAAIAEWNNKIAKKKRKAK